VPADGFYEWQWQDSKGKNKQKFFMHLPDEALFSFAGLWNEWQNQVTGEYYHTYTILTTEANELMAKVHNSKKRMPVIISPQTEMDWLKGGKLSLYNDFLLADALRTTQQMDLWGDL
jgi:putative SOS response-associated peptidase YedK